MAIGRARDAIDGLQQILFFDHAVGPGAAA